MKHYKKMLIWENTLRLRKLISFANLVTQYFNNLEPIGFLEVKEDNKARRARSEINSVIDEAHRFIIEAGITPIIYYSPPPAFGGLAGTIDVVQNIFNLHRFQIPPQDLLDFIQRAVGIYDNDRFNAFLRTINPFFWIYLLLDFLVSIPFKLLGLTGFDQSKMENSLIGRMFKLVSTVLICAATFLTILEKLGYIETFKGWITR